MVCLDTENALLNPKFILSLAGDLQQNTNLKVASFCEPITKINDMEDRSIVKVILNKRQHAMYFTRSPIPSCHKEYRVQVKFRFQKDNAIGILVYMLLG